MERGSRETNSVSKRWDREYRLGRYRSEPPVPFVGRILKVLEKRLEIREGRGLYVGCGNGRNFLPLLDAGLDLLGLDVSVEALSQLKSARPDLAPRLIHAGFSEFESEAHFDYLVAIQVFQHGTAGAVRSMFARAASVLKDGGLLFVRVNSASTEVYYRHQIIETADNGGFTVRYDEGPNAGLAIHFLSREELKAIVGPRFTAVAPVTEQVTPRGPEERLLGAVGGCVGESRGAGRSCGVSPVSPKSMLVRGVGHP